MRENWSKEELEAAVAAYLEMRNKELNNIQFVKKDYYKLLAERYGRTEKSFEYRMQNISYVFSTLGRPSVSGLKPAKNVGARVAQEIEQIINKLEGNYSANVSEFEIKVAELRRKREREKPKGVDNPSKTPITTTQYQRDPGVVAWVLNKANGICESCGKSAPFERVDGTPFLEVHHLRMLADGGSDSVSNAVALCPNCHREFHYGMKRKEKLENIYRRIGRLVKE